MPRRIAISDVHGCVATLRTLLKHLELSPGDELFFLGDFIDRGPGSKEVIDAVWALAADRIITHCLRGNHEQMLLDSGQTPHRHKVWLYNGGIETLQSFGVDRVPDIPRRYLEWMASLPLYLETPGYILVHAGIDFSSDDPLAEEAALLWLRNWYGNIDREWLDGRVVIHGHTPTPYPLIQKQANRLDRMPVLNIDAGCVFDQKAFGYLCAFDLDERKLHFQTNVEQSAS